jgi:hypothetical protein
VASHCHHLLQIGAPGVRVGLEKLQFNTSGGFPKASIENVCVIYLKKITELGAAELFPVIYKNRNFRLEV